MVKAQNGNFKEIPQFEAFMWEEHWLSCVKHLNQWELLTDYAKQQVIKYVVTLVT